MIPSKESSSFATFVKALDFGASPAVDAVEESLGLLATGGSEGSTTSWTWSAGAGACAGGCISGGTMVTNAPGSAGKMGYGTWALGSVFVHGLPITQKILD